MAYDIGASRKAARYTLEFGIAKGFYAGTKSTIIQFVCTYSHDFRGAASEHYFVSSPRCQP